MRNKKAFDYGVDTWDTGYIGNPTQPFHGPWEDYGWDYDYDDWDWYDQYDSEYRSRELVKHHFKNSNRDSIRMKLQHVRRNKNCRNVFEDLIAGNFCIVVYAGTLIADKYYIDSLCRYGETIALKKGFSINIYEFDGNDMLWIDVAQDKRFSMTKWAQKVVIDAENHDLHLNEIVEIIAHCVRLERVSSFV